MAVPGPVRMLRNSCVYLSRVLSDCAAEPRKFVMMRLRETAIIGVATVALATAPINPAFARWHRGPVFWPFALGAAVVAGAAIVATAPLRALAAPVYGPPPYY